MSQLAFFGGSPTVEPNSVHVWPSPQERHMDALRRVIESGKFHRVNHPIVQEFETELARWSGASSSRAVSSGTAAIHIAGEVLSDEGETVYVPAMNWPGAVGPIAARGRKIVFLDVELETACLGSEGLSLVPEGGAVFCTHLFGNWSRAADVVDSHRMFHDCAQAFDAIRHVRFAEGHSAAVSGNGAKHLAAGELGAIVTSDERLIEHVDRVSLSSSSRNGHRIFSPNTLGFNYRPNVFSTALGLDRLTEMEDQLARRRENASYLADRILPLPGISALFDRSENRNSFLVMALRFVGEELDLPSSAATRDNVVQLLEAEGVPVSVWLRQPVWEFLPHVAAPEGNFPHTEKILETEFHITEFGTPNSVIQMKSIADAFDKVWEHLARDPQTRTWVGRDVR